MRFAVMSLMLVLLLSGLPAVYAGHTTEGGNQSGDHDVSGTFWVKQEEYDTAKRFTYSTTSKDDGIKGWKITTTKFSGEQYGGC